MSIRSAYLAEGLTIDPEYDPDVAEAVCSSTTVN